MTKGRGTSPVKSSRQLAVDSRQSKDSSELCEKGPGLPGFLREIDLIDLIDSIACPVK